ncbi:MAG: AAA family ATPase, partial [Nitrososphaerales archaeon]
GEWETLKQLRLILGCDEDHIDKNKEAWFICPLHPPDRTPSFSYNLSTNRFSCFHEIGKLKGCWLGDLRRKLQPASGGRPTPTVEIISGDDLIAEPINETPTILNPHIPVGGITLLFGPPGVGKTALNWALGNAIVKGEDFLGHQTIKGQMLFVSLDMNNTLCKIRLHNTGFVPKFDFVFSDLPVDCLSSNFKGTELYKKVREKVTETSYALIVIDALGRLGRFDMSADNIPSQVYGSLREWLPGQTFLINHHSRKQKFNYKGDLIRRSMEDAFGSQFWTAYAASVVQLHRTGSQNGTLLHVKSQVLELADPISVCIDPESSTVCLLEDRKKVTAKSRMKLWEQKAKVLFPAWDSMGVEEQVKALRKVSGKSRRTIYTCLEELKKGGSEV